MDDLFEHAPCGYLTLLADGTIARVNETLLAWTGFEQADLVDRRRFPDLLSVGGRIYFETHLRPMLQVQGTLREVALEMVCADGRRLPVLVNAAVRAATRDDPALTRLTVVDATERRGYERELLRARGRTERLQRLTSTVAATSNTAEVGTAIVQDLMAGEAVVACVLALIEWPTGTLSVLAQHGDGPGVAELWASLAIDAGRPTAEVLVSTEPLFGPIDEQTRALFPSLAGDTAGAVAAIPLVAGRRALGVLCVVTRAPAFAAEDRAFLVAVAEQGAQAIDRAQLVEGTRVAADRAAFLVATGRVLEESQGVRERVERLLDLVVPRLADHASIQMEGRDMPTISAGGVAPVGPEELPAVAHRTMRRVMGSGEPRLTDDAGVSLACLPLRSNGRVIGSLLLVCTAPRRAYGADDLPFLTGLADQAGLALENARLYENERDISSALQRSMISGVLPDQPEVGICVEYRPGARDMQVGGDWYDAFMVAERRIGIVVGDVVGHGLGAAAAMGQLRSALRALARARLGVEAVIDHLDLFASDSEGARLATVAYAEIDLDTGAMRWCCAGHPPPLVTSPGRDPQYLWEGRSLPLGIGGSDRGAGERTLAPGSRLLLYTDGVVERRDESLDAGFERLAEAMRRSAASPLAEVASEIADAMMGDPQGRVSDDVCVLCIAFHDPE